MSMSMCPFWHPEPGWGCGSRSAKAPLFSCRGAVLRCSPRCLLLCGAAVRRRSWRRTQMTWHWQGGGLSHESGWTGVAPGPGRDGTGCRHSAAVMDQASMNQHVHCNRSCKVFVGSVGSHGWHEQSGDRVRMVLKVYFVWCCTWS